MVTATFCMVCGSIFLIYFLPSFVAAGRGARHASLVLLINLFCGWTAIGWFGSLILACCSERSADREAREALMMAAAFNNPTALSRYAYVEPGRFSNSFWKVV